MNRSKTDLCLLCETELANQTNSHIVPAGLIKHMVGKRDYEESFLTNTRKGIIDEFSGRSNIKNMDAEIKPHHYTEDFWFCHNCEKRLSNIENKAIAIIDNKLRDKRLLSSFDQKISSKGNRFISLHGFKTEFELFFYSILWRLNLKYRFNLGKKIIDSDKESLIKQIINNNLPSTAKAVVIKNWKTIPHIILIPSDIKLSRVFIFSDDRFKNPNLFFITEFVILFFQNAFSSNFENDEFELENYVDTELLIGDDDELKIGIINHEKWDFIVKCVNKIKVSSLFEKWIIHIAENHKITDYEARNKLQNRAKEIQSKGKTATHAYQIAYEELTSKSK